VHDYLGVKRKKTLSRLVHAWGSNQDCSMRNAHDLMGRGA